MKIHYAKKDIILFLISAIAIAGAMFLAYLPRAEITPQAARVLAPAFHVDPSGTETPEQAAQGTWTPLARPRLYANRTKDTYWIKFRLPANPAPGNAFVHIESASAEDLRVYFRGHQPVLLGKKVPSAQVPIKTRLWNVPVPADCIPGETVLIRVRTNTIMLVPLSILTVGEALADANTDSLIFGVFFGVLITVFFVNLFTWLAIRNANFLTYLAYIAFLFLYHVRVHGFLWFLPIPFPILEAIVWISLGGFGTFMMLFAQRFLELKERMPVMHRILNGGIVLFIGQTVLGCAQLNFLANQIAYVTGFLVPLVILATTTYLYFTGMRQVRFYLLAWCFLFTGTLVWSTSAYLESYLPSNYIFMMGTSIDTLLFTLAIFDQFRRELLEKDEHIERERYYQKLSHTDSLTGLYNRHYLNDLIQRLSSEEDIPPESAVIMIDIDNFKIVNDTYGHLVGDMFLTKLGTKIRNNVRKSDIACRYGGDEFLIFLPGATERAAMSIAESIREAMHADFVYSEQGQPIHVSVSAGITSSRSGDSFDGIFLRADAALYQAKRTGRNRISVL